MRDGGELPLADDGLFELTLSPAMQDALAVQPGDLVFVDDARWWLGGLRSARCRLAATAGSVDAIVLPAAIMQGNHWPTDHKVVLARIE